MTATATLPAPTGPEGLTVDAVAWDDPVAAGLRAAQEAEMAMRYGGVDEAPAIDPRSIVVTLVARLDGRPVGSVAVRDVSGTDDRRGRGTTHPAATGEVKRLYVDGDARGRGVARRLMGELERSARQVGFRRFVLETGTAQPEAIALYEAIGYEPIESFGDHTGFEQQRCYGKRI
ncbi:GNAT family N-acetyltransferase [Krasilnikoviella flava]|uniref:Acetyltransferase (GNAT) family protein n=1 Tax=Krasilnikoviella flava TaxID=526729 RepID=A0A1T5LJC8_9MICO|nr:GNAT family N-acetyltransferase [Krasilnikoviella flava]SKC75905.1 Acetyltransferase (GNAT) family protein [Krasilnikoviella flava]